MVVVEMTLEVEVTLEVIFSYTCNFNHNHRGYARIMMIL